MIMWDQLIQTTLRTSFFLVPEIIKINIKRFLDFEATDITHTLCVRVNYINFLFDCSLLLLL